MRAFLALALSLLLLGAGQADVARRAETQVNSQLKKLVMTSQPQSLQLDSYRQGAPSLDVATDRERFRAGRLELPPQSWPFPMVHLAPQPVLPGTAGW